MKTASKRLTANRSMASGGALRAQPRNLSSAGNYLQMASLAR